MGRAALWLAVILAFVIMTLFFGIATEKFVLRKLVNQPPIALFMATIGLAFFIEGLAPMVFGSAPRALELGIVDEPIPWILDNWNMVISPVRPGGGRGRLRAGRLAGPVLPIHPRWPGAVADDHQAALSIGIPLQNIGPSSGASLALFAVGCRHDVVAAMACSLHSLFTALKTLPVLILGGFTSVPGAIVGGLIIGASEKLAEIYVPPVMQDIFGGNFGGIEGWFPYVLALLLPLSSGPRGCLAKNILITCVKGDQDKMLYREAGQFKTTLRCRPATLSHPSGPDWRHRAARRRVPGVPLFASEYWFSAILIPFLIFALAALGLNILTGYAGQLSLGSAAFMAVGAYAAYNFQLRIEGIPLLVSFIFAGLNRSRRRILSGCHRSHRLLPRRGDAGGAVLHRLVPDQVPVVVEQLVVGRDLGRPEADHLRPRARRRSKVSAGPFHRRRHGAGRQEHGAFVNRPRLDGGARHGRGGLGDRHPPDADQAVTPSPSAPSTVVSRVRCMPSAILGRSSRTASRSKCRSGFCS